MSIYDDRQSHIPQVRLASIDRNRLYAFLSIYNRTYSDFIRDLCDAVGKFRNDYHEETFIGLGARMTEYLSKSYDAGDKLKRTRVINSADSMKLYEYPTKQIARLPSVPVSSWQYDNLVQFLRIFNRTHSEFIRDICRNIRIDTIAAQAKMAVFSENVTEVFAETVDELTKRDESQRRQMAANRPGAQPLRGQKQLPR